MVPVRKPLPRGLKGTKPMPSSSHVGQHLLLGTPPPQRVLALDGGHRLHGMGAADRPGGSLRHPEVLHLAGLDEVLDCAGDVFDGHVRVDSVLVVEVDDLDAEPLQRAVDDVLDGLGTTGDPPTRLTFLRVDVPAELRGDHDLVAVGREGLTDELLVVIGAVDLRSVEEGDTEVHCGPEQRDHLLPVGPVAVATAHAHAAEPDGRDVQAVRSQGALVHAWTLSCRWSGAAGRRYRAGVTGRSAGLDRSAAYVRRRRA